jgi:uncharacterized membrane protein YgcG
METRYRLLRMQTLYPEVMTADTLHTLNTALDSGSLAEFRRAATVRTVEVNRIITDMRTRAEAAKSGSRGSGSSGFGGGRSSGGGGGRW